MARPIRVLLASALVLTGCSALIGVNDIFLDPKATSPGDEGGPSSEASTVDAPAGEGGSETSTCTDTQTDKKNCGRCGHDCFGGNCNAGKCEAIALAQGLAAPDALALDANNVYIANLGDGSVVRVAKTGGAVQQLVTGWRSVRGVAVDNGRLFWSAFEGLGDAGDGNFGGVWACTLPACTDKKTISTVGYVRHIDAKDGFVYFAHESSVRRVKADGTGEITLTGANQAFAVAADATHVYYTSNEASISRVPIAGGPSVNVGPQNSNVVGYMTVDATRFFWAYTDTASKGQAYAGLKAAPGTRIGFGTANEGTVGINGDDTNVFWGNDGTVTGMASNNDGELLTCPVAGCPGDPVKLHTKMAFAGPIALDQTAVYFIEFGGRLAPNGRVLRIAKP